MLTRSASRRTLRCLEIVGWLASSSWTSSPTALSPLRRAIRMSRLVASAMTANTSSVTMPSTLATYTPDGIHELVPWCKGPEPGPDSVEPGVQSVQGKHFLTGGHDGAVHLVVGVETHFPGPPPEVHVVAHRLGGLHAEPGAVLVSDVVAPVLRNR